MIKAKSLPKWATLDRRNVLVQLFLDSGGFCAYGHKPCQGFTTLVVKGACGWGYNCNSPTLDRQLCRFEPNLPCRYGHRPCQVFTPLVEKGQLCRYKPEPDKPHLPCRYTVFFQRRWHCFYGVNSCLKRFGSHYENYADILIADWKRLDKEQRLADWEAESKVIHHLGEQAYPVLGRFNAISKDIFASNQPLYYLEGQAVSGLTLTPFVKVRIASSYMRLFIDLGKALRGVSKNRRRKAIRYGKPLPQETQVIIRRKVLEAVRDYLAH